VVFFAPSMALSMACFEKAKALVAPEA